MREEGYYWARIITSRELRVVEWSDGCWWIGGTPFDGTKLIIVGDRLIPPKEL
jgi:hypothetical protein